MRGLGRAAIGAAKHLVHDGALEYAPIHRVAVLLWPPRFEGDLWPYLLRLDVARLFEQ